MEWYTNHVGRNTIVALSAGILAAATAVGAVLVPRAEWSRVAQPATQSIYGFFLALAVLALARASGHVRLGRAVLALFLAAMPVVYLRAALEHPGARIWPEVVGAVLFAGVAAGGYSRPGLLVAGIALHGVVWDLWHLGTGPVPTWYAVFCAVVDAGVAAYAAGRLAAWN